jgi:hypothetical protein
VKDCVGVQVRAHWRKYRARMARELDQGGTLDDAVHAAEALTVSAHAQAISVGLMPIRRRNSFARTSCPMRTTFPTPRPSGIPGAT